MLMRAPAARRQPAVLKSMLAASSAVLGATVIVVATAGGTYGLWADSAPVNAGVVTSGTLTLLVDNGQTVALDATRMAAMFPGDRVQYPVMLTNSGTVSADVTVSATSSAAAKSDYTVEVTQDPCPLGAADLTSENSLVAQTAVGVWAGGQASAGCIEVTLSGASSASMGTTVPLTITFTATQRPRS